MRKRILDISIATIGLLLSLPLMMFISIWIKVDSTGPIFYRPYRGGRFGVPFKIYKFRSMKENADKIGGPSTSSNDSRVTRSGRLIRKIKLDEISQLINVLYGDMSLVGPRPEVLWKLKNYSQDEMRTLSLRPGITDWASIWNSNEGGILEGAPDPDVVYEEVIRPNKMKLQLYYLETHNIYEDMKIIYHTILRIVNKRWVPKEIKSYPSFEKLRSEALISIEKQKVRSLNLETN